MIALLLCAGYGTRLRPLTDETPKGLLEVAGRPVIDYLIRQISDWQELEEIHLLANEAESVDYLRWWQNRWHRALKARGLTFHLHGNDIPESSEQRGAVGDLAYLRRRVGRYENALVASSDCIYRFPLQAAKQEFQDYDNLALALCQPDEEKRRQQSVLQFEEGSDRIARVLHAADDPPSDWICPALYFFKRTALQQLEDYLEGGGDADTLGSFVDYLARRDSVQAYRVGAEQNDMLTEDRLRFHINTREELKRANEVLETNSLMVQA